MSDTNQLTLQAYNDHTQEYIDGTIKSVEGALKLWIDKNLRQLPISAKILELGSAFGRDAEYMESKGYTVECTDASSSFIKLLNGKGHSAKLLNAITDRLGEDHDMIFANAVSHHFSRDEMMHVTSGVYKALSVGGRFAFSIKEGDGEEWLHEKLSSPRFFCYWQPDDLRMLLRLAGFKAVECKIIGHYRPNAHRFLLIIAIKGQAA